LCAVGCGHSREREGLGTNNSPSISIDEVDKELEDLDKALEDEKPERKRERGLIWKSRAKIVKEWK